MISCSWPVSYVNVGCEDQITDESGNVSVTTIMTMQGASMVARFFPYANPKCVRGKSH